ncbi:MAG: M1 family metallopeptidase [Candidatus Saccharimonadales bacterium]
MGKSVKRLYDQFKPNNYKLTVKIDTERMLFNGSVVIKGRKTGRPSQRITFHQNGLTITEAKVIKLEKSSHKIIDIDRINLLKKTNEVRLHSLYKIYPGEYEVTLTFKGVITPQMNGVYPCNYVLKNDKKQLIATQFESHHAREVFPCIDEPEAKSTFDLTLITPGNETVIANTPIVKQSYKNQEYITEFETTPKMSTYLLAFVYGDLKYLESKTNHGVSVRSYATEENVNYTKFALEVAVKCLDFYDEYFDLPYPLPKCDLIALPDFASGAMENWGCITFREHALLVDPKNTTLATKQYVAMVVAHELAHQWFGNLVTMRWWTDLWLNEGFASWMEYFVIDRLFPEWQMWTQFAIDEQQQALKLDALENTHPVEVTVQHPDEIRTIFDAISYSKGASVIHMLHEFLSPDVFRDGLRHYLKLHIHDNTDTSDLWNALEDVSERPVKEFMNCWTSAAGFPLLNVTVTDQKVEINQSRFFINPHHTHIAETIWPVALLSQSDQLTDLFTTNKINIESRDTTSVKINRGQSGFYRVTYNASHLKTLGEQILKGHLSALDRLGVLSDLFESAKAAKANTVDALYFLKYYRGESDYAVWDTITSAIGTLRLVMDDENLREAMKPYIRNLIEPQLERLGWNRIAKESHFDRLLRPTILGLAASTDEPTIIKKCLELFSTINNADDVEPDHRVTPSTTEIKRGVDIDPDLRGTVFGTVARLGGKKEFEKLLYLHNTTHLSEERTTIAAAITGFKQPELIHRSLSLIDSSTVRLQDVAYWIAYSFLNRHGKNITWEWMKDKWDWLSASLGSDLSFYRMPIYAARVFSDPAFKDEYKNFFGPKVSPAFDRSYKQGLEMLDWQSDWKKRDFNAVLAFFKNSSLK